MDIISFLMFFMTMVIMIITTKPESKDN